MPSSAISQDILRFLEKISHLTIEETQEVENFIDFLLSKKENESHYSDIIPDNTKDTLHAEISDFIASFTSSHSDVSEMQPQPIPDVHSPLYVSEESIEGNEIPNESGGIKETCSIESNHVIVAPEEPVSEKYPADIDFADINARFAKKREERKKEDKNNKGTHSEDLDWL